MKNLQIVEANYVEAYKVALTFSNGHKSEVDIFPFLNSTQHPTMKQYLDLDKFKSFKVEEDNIVWGINWDLIFPLARLYKGKV